jgi:4-hydroxybenzoate polyprenyltransferase
VSNLPTVLSNVLCGLTLAGAHARATTSARIAAGMCALYAAGMVLNDVCDRVHDGRVRPRRPIPSGAISAGDATLLGVALLGVGVLALATSARGLAAGLTLAGLIVWYDLRHKTGRIAPFLMGGCRAMVYVGAAAAAHGGCSSALVWGAAMLFSYVAVLTWWSHRGGAMIGQLVAGISLLDAILLLSMGNGTRAATAILCVFATRWAQRFVRGT